MACEQFVESQWGMPESNADQCHTCGSSYAEHSLPIEYDGMSGDYSRSMLLTPVTLMEYAKKLMAFAEKHPDLIVVNRAGEYDRHDSLFQADNMEDNLETCIGYWDEIRESFDLHRHDLSKHNAIALL